MIQTGKAERTRARILDAAYRLFLKQGYHGTSMRQVAQASSLTLGGIYAHFAGKEAIWKDVLLTRHPYRQIMPLLAETQGEQVDEAVRDAAHRFVGELGRRDDLLNLIFIEIVEFDGKHLPLVIREMAKDAVKISQHYDALLGSKRPVSKATLARFFGGLFVSYYITSRMIPPELEGFVNQTSLDEFVDIFLYGILADDDPSRRAHAAIAPDLTHS